MYFICRKCRADSVINVICTSILALADSGCGLLSRAEDLADCSCKRDHLVQ